MTDTIITSKDLDFNERTHRYKIAGSKPAKYIPSVTTITGLMDKPYLFEWAAKEAANASTNFMAEQQGNASDRVLQASVAVGRAAPREARNHGASVGTAVHQRIKFFLDPEGEDPETYAPESFESELALEAFYTWNESYLKDKKVLLSEQMVVHPTGLYCGTFDLLIQLEDGSYQICDFKTTNKSDANPLGIYPEYFMQLSAYRKALIDSPEFPHITRDNIRSGMLIGTGKDGSLSSPEISGDDMDRYENAFMLLAAILPAYRAMEADVRKMNKQYKERLSNADG